MTTVSLAGRGGVPTTGVKAVIVNVTAVSPSAGGYLTVYPGGTARPTASNVNYKPAQTVANQAIVKVSSAGQITVFTSAKTHLLVDVTGYVPTAATYTPLSPTRLLDTRTTTIPGAGSTTAVTVLGRAGVPATGVAAVVLNVTAVTPAGSGYLTEYPTGVARPTASNVNFTTGSTTAGMVIAKVGTGGQVNLFTSARTHLLVDVAGWFPTGSDYTALTPARLLDTRSGTGAARARVAAGGVVTFQVLAAGGVPANGADAAEINVTVVNPDAAGYVTAWPAGSTRPGASTVNYARGVNTANSVTLKLGTGGKVSLYTSAATDLIADVAGYFSAPVAITPTITTTSLPAGTVGASYTATLAATGGTPPYTWTATGLPTGLTLSSNGAIAGTPTTGGIATVRATVRDSTGATAITTLTLAVTGGSGAGTVKQISAGDTHTCAVLTNGAAKCWGLNLNGELGNGSIMDSVVPAPVTGLSSGVASITAGIRRTCAVLTSGAAKCWGYNVYGGLGNGTTIESHVPVPVTGLSSGVASITAGGYHTCAVLVSGAATCWGSNQDGELGNGTTTDSAIPVPVTGLSSGVASITASYWHTCAVLVSGAATCWGMNLNGQLGNGTTTDSAIPVPVTGLSSGVASITPGGNHTCAVLVSGAAKCWGSGRGGQLGNGGTDSTVPVTVTGLEAAL